MFNLHACSLVERIIKILVIVTLLLAFSVPQNIAAQTSPPPPGDPAVQSADSHSRPTVEPLVRKSITRGPMPVLKTAPFSAAKNGKPSRPGAPALAADSNLLPYTPSVEFGWTAPLILSTKKGAVSSSNLQAGAAFYVNFALGNAGTADITQSFVVCLLIDGSARQPLACFSVSNLPAGYFVYLQDYLLDAVTIPAGRHTVTLWIDANNQVIETNENDNQYDATLTWMTSSAPNITFYIPPGQTDPVELRSDTNGYALFSNRPTIVNVGVINSGAATSKSFTVALSIDGAVKLRGNVTLGSSSTALVTFRLDPSPAAGLHTVTVKLDEANSIAEFNETDNRFEADYTWEPVNLPNLHPYQPSGWYGPIVPSSIQGTNMVNPLTAGQTAYVDLALINDGFIDIPSSGSFIFTLYVDGSAKKTWSWTGGLQVGWYLYVQDYAMTVTAAGWHKLSLVADSGTQVTEIDEGDNLYEESFYWQAANEKPILRVDPDTISVQIPGSAGSALEPQLLTRDMNRLPDFDPTSRGTGLVLTSPTKLILPAVPLDSTSSSSLAASVDLSSKLPPVGDQGQAGSCVGWSSSYYTKSAQESVDQQWSSLATTDHQFSPNFVWNQAQVNLPACGGVQINAAMDLITQMGDATVASFGPYTVDCTRQPTQAMKDAAMNYRAQNYGAFFQNNDATDTAITQMKQWLSGGDPLVIGIPVYGEFDQPSGANCIVDIVDHRGQSRGGHAIALVGYNDNIGGTGKSGFKFVNSWSKDYGCGGFGYVTYDWVKRYAYQGWWMRDIRTGGGKSTLRDITIFNDGSGTLQVSGIARRGSSGWLSIALPQALPIFVGPRQNVTINLNINPAGLSNGSYTEHVDVTTSAGSEAVTVKLQVGTGSVAAPSTPKYIKPSNGAKYQSFDNLGFAWQACAPQSGQTITYDVRLDTVNPPAQVVCNDTTATQCAVGGLQKNTLYYWRVIASNSQKSTLGPVYTLTTANQVINWLPLFLPLIRR